MNNFSFIIYLDLERFNNLIGVKSQAHLIYVTMDGFYVEEIQSEQILPLKQPHAAYAVLLVHRRKILNENPLYDSCFCSILQYSSNLFV